MAAHHGDTWVIWKQKTHHEWPINLHWVVIHLWNLWDTSFDRKYSLKRASYHPELINQQWLLSFLWTVYFLKGPLGCNTPMICLIKSNLVCHNYLRDRNYVRFHFCVLKGWKVGSSGTVSMNSNRCHYISMHTSMGYKPQLHPYINLVLTPSQQNGNGNFLCVFWASVQIKVCTQSVPLAKQSVSLVQDSQRSTTAQLKWVQ